MIGTTTQTPVATTPAARLVVQKRLDLVGTEIYHNCTDQQIRECFGRVAWTCHDYLTIATFGEHYVSLKIHDSNVGRVQECASGWVSSFISETWWQSEYDSSQKGVLPTQTPLCWNIDLAKQPNCIACQLLSQSTPARTRRHARKSTSQRKAERRARVGTMPICMA